jgi:hypothetical protein
VRLIAVAVLSWLIAAITTSAAFAVVYNERPSAEDLLGHGIVTFVTCSVLVLACYLPAVWVLRRRLGGKLSAVQTIIATGVIANAPAFLVLAVLASRADLFAAGEALWIAFPFFLFGVLFGLGFARYGQKAA